MEVQPHFSHTPYLNEKNMRHPQIQSVTSLSELKTFIYQTLCHDHELLMNAFPTSETLLRRGKGELCGIMFCLHGPRSVKFTAIWERDHNRVLFYGPTGKRYGEIDLVDGESIEMPEMIAR